MVGAVVVHNERIIGEGYHRTFGDIHAEVAAIRAASQDVAGATMYVTLEPCCHWGKQPPCVDVLIRHRIRRVVIATLDPNPLVNGRGVSLLREHGITIELGVLAEEARRLNETYMTYMTSGRPFVTLKYAQSIDGKIAAASGDSQWISSERSRRMAHRLRATHDAIMVGIGTVLVDNPRLTVRMVKGRNPLRVILDSSLRVPLDAAVINDDGNVLIASTARCDRDKYEALARRNREVIVLPADAENRVDMTALLDELGRRTISSVLVEGGKAIITTVIAERLVDRAVIVTAPFFLGQGVEAVGNLDIVKVDDALRPSSVRLRRIDQDVVFDLRMSPGVTSAKHGSTS
jgi:diaminohydroxyphosphoribosylaminopyrimidine deaminase/5-amino-6-(5-phosphoribosylamino)uracil reductase